MQRSEFSIADEHRYDRSTPGRWIVAHIRRYPLLPLGLMIASIGGNLLMSYSRVLVGDAFDWILGDQPALRALLFICLLVAGARLGHALLGLLRNGCVELLAQRLERDCRDELYLSLLGKSLTYHGQQRVGDLMARATNDVRQINLLVSPGLNLIFDSVIAVVVPVAMMAAIRLELAIMPLVFCALLAVTLRGYVRRLTPVSDAMRQQFGVMNAGLAEAISGIEVVKANAQEAQERAKFGAEAARFRDLFVAQGRIQARYLPYLVFAVTSALALLHALLIYMRGDGLGVGDVVAYMGLYTSLRHPTFLSIFTFMQVQLGLAGAGRILTVLNSETELDENERGLRRPMRGEVVFENVSFGYRPDAPVLKDISFRARAGETIAIVGQTGSGKTSLTRLINRVYDATEGRVLVDGVDVREWNLESLRSQIATIEQDVFLFSRTVAENIAFGVGQHADQERIERCAREAQAHEFIRQLPHGYETRVGERGVTLSGGQRQRIAIARSFLADPRILILDDSTSAIDSATEDEIQRAMYRVQQGRTTFLITHRLSQIRWADRVLVLRRGGLVDQGGHEELLERCEAYRRIFSPAERATADTPTDQRSAE